MLVVKVAYSRKNKEFTIRSIDECEGTRHTFHCSMEINSRYPEYIRKVLDKFKLGDEHVIQFNLVDDRAGYSRRTITTYNTVVDQFLSVVNRVLKEVVDDE